MALRKVDDPLSRAMTSGGRTRSTNDTYTGVQGKRAVSAVASLTGALGGLQRGFDQLGVANANERLTQEAQDETDDGAAGAAAYNVSKTRLAEAVRTGQIDAGASPAYREGYANAQLRVMASEYTADIREEMGKNPALGEDTAAFNAYEQTMFRQYAQDNFAGKPLSDKSIMDNFMTFRDNAKSDLQLELIKRNNKTIQIKAENMVKQEITVAIDAWRNKVNSEEVGDIVSVIIKDHLEFNPNAGRTANVFATNALVTAAVAKRDPSILDAASFIVTGTGKLSGTTDFRSAATQARKVIRSDIERSRARSNAAATRNRAAVQRRMQQEWFNKIRQDIDDGMTYAQLKHDASRKSKTSQEQAVRLDLIQQAMGSDQNRAMRIHSITQRAFSPNVPQEERRALLHDLFLLGAANGPTALHLTKELGAGTPAEKHHQAAVLAVESGAPPLIKSSLKQISTAFLAVAFTRKKNPDDGEEIISEEEVAMIWQSKQLLAKIELEIVNDMAAWSIEHKKTNIDMPRDNPTSYVQDYTLELNARLTTAKKVLQAQLGNPKHFEEVREAWAEKNRRESLTDVQRELEDKINAIAAKEAADKAASEAADRATQTRLQAADSLRKIKYKQQLALADRGLTEDEYRRDQAALHRPRRTGRLLRDAPLPDRGVLIAGSGDRVDAKNKAIAYNITRRVISIVPTKWIATRPVFSSIEGGKEGDNVFDLQNSLLEKKDVEFKNFAEPPTPAESLELVKVINTEEGFRNAELRWGKGFTINFKDVMNGTIARRNLRGSKIVSINAKVEGIIGQAGDVISGAAGKDPRQDDEKEVRAGAAAASQNAIVAHHYRNVANNSTVTRPDGSVSTVFTAQVDLNPSGQLTSPSKGGKPTLIPLIWDGEQLEVEDTIDKDGRTVKGAVTRARESGKNWPTAPTHDELLILDKELHNSHMTEEGSKIEFAQKVMERIKSLAARKKR